MSRNPWGNRIDKRSMIHHVRQVLHPETIFDTRVTDDDDVDLICESCATDRKVDVHYSHDVFLFLDALAHLARCRYVIVNRRRIVMDTDMLCDGDVVIFDRVRYEQLNPDAS